MDRQHTYPQTIICTEVLVTPIDGHAPLRSIEADGSEKSEEPMDVNRQKDVREELAEIENDVYSSDDWKGACSGRSNEYELILVCVD